MKLKKYRLIMLFFLSFFILYNCSKENSVENYLKSAKKYLQTGQFNMAIDACKKAAMIEPDNEDVNYCLGISYGRSGQQQQAVESFQRIIRMNPNNYEAYYNLGTSYAIIKQYDNAITYFKKAIKILPDYPEPHYGLGLTYFKTGNMEGAFAEYEILKGLDDILSAQLAKQMKKS
ncbi:MAG: tetratricopeptide repeat protein [Nitrospirota bacterium]